MRMGFWNWEGWPRPEEWSAWWAFGTFVVAATAAYVALRQLRAYLREQEERARPYLVVDFDFSSILLYLTLENISATPATNVTMTSTPMLESNMPERDEALAGLLGGGFVIPQVAPGRKMRWLVDSAPSLFDDTERPHKVTVIVEYTDPRAVGNRDPYVEPFVLDIDQYGEASGEVDYERDNLNLAKENAKRLESLKGSLSSVALTLDTLLGIDESQKAARRREPMLARRRRRQAERGANDPR